MIDKIELNLLKEIADLHGIPTGAYNIRKNGKSRLLARISSLRYSTAKQLISSILKNQLGLVHPDFRYSKLSFDTVTDIYHFLLFDLLFFV